MIYPNAPLQVGIIGTGFAAQARAEALAQSQLVSLVAVAGQDEARTRDFADKYGIGWFNAWQELINLRELDLVIICTTNNLHGAIAQAALNAGKHVIIEYPLSLDLNQAQQLIELAKTKNLLLHVEHIEILGGLHQTIKEYLPHIGKVFYARYITVKIDNPAPQKWTYNHQLYGFPLMAAVSRIHRFTNLFGKVSSVTCQAKFWDIPNTDYYSACLCQAQMKFYNGLIADITYGKGDKFWQGYRDFELNGEEGSLIFQGNKGYLITSAGKQEIVIPSRRGLFQQDTEIILKHLLTKSDLYVSNQDSYYALKIAEAARKSSETGLSIVVN
jgi:biliverdin reductase